MGLADSSIDILVGTHAIFQQAVVLKDLALVVVDEQHRFGVAQRVMLTPRAARPPAPARDDRDPIPRTLQLANHGEMDVSQIDEMPPGLRRSIRASSRSTSSTRSSTNSTVIWRAGRRPIGCVHSSPRAKSASLLRPKSARPCCANGWAPARVGLVHGRMKGPRRMTSWRVFRAGEIGVLVAATVIEVEVDVPAAGLVIVEGMPDRFGLAQLTSAPRPRRARYRNRCACCCAREHLSKPRANGSR